MSEPGRGQRHSLRLLLVATFAASIGTGVTTVAYPWLVVSLTRNPLMLSAIAVTGQLPGLILLLPAGGFIDRSDLRKMLGGAHWSRALLMLALTLLLLRHEVSLPLLFVQCALLGVISLASVTAQQTMVPRLVPPERLPRANSALFLAEEMTTGFIGPVAAGVMLAAGLAVPFGGDAVAFALSGLLMLFLPAAAGGVAAAGRAAAAGGPDLPERPGMADLASGLRYFRRHPALRGIGVIFAGLSLCEGLMTGTLVLFAQNVLHLGARGYSLLYLAGACGGVAGTVLVPVAVRRIGGRHAVLVALAGFGVTSLVAAMSASAVVIAIAFGITIALVAIWNVITISHRQRVSPPPLLGRLTAIHRLLGLAALPAGTLLGGLLVTVAAPLGGAVSLHAPFMAASVIMFALFLAARHLLRPADWAIPAEAEGGPGENSPEPSADLAPDRAAGSGSHLWHWILPPSRIFAT